MFPLKHTRGKENTQSHEKNQEKRKSMHILGKIIKNSSLAFYQYLTYNNSNRSH